MKIAFFSTKPYDRIYFAPFSEQYGYKILFIEAPLTSDTVLLATGCDGVCVFVNDHVTEEIISILSDLGVRLLLLRCAGFNNVDLKAAKGRLTILRVPSYSPDAVAEFAIALLLTINRKTHKAYNRTRDFNMSLNGLIGTDLAGKTAGVIGTGKIGQAMIRILTGFHMEILAYDPYPAPDLNASYVDLDYLYQNSDVISLHCPLTDHTYHLIDEQAISKIKKDSYLINTSRGALIDSAALLEALKNGSPFAAVALDVYEEEDGLFYEDNSEKIVADDQIARLLSFPNVLITSHQAFLTKEALEAIALVTMENIRMYEEGKPLVNEVIG